MKKSAVFVASMAVALSAAAVTPPAYPGGEEEMNSFIASNLCYPARAQENGIEGVVTLKVTVNADGKIGKVSVERPLDPDLEEEAIRIIGLMPAWNPAVNDAGMAISHIITLPVRFRIPAE